MASEIDPLDVLKEDLKDDSVEVQLEAISALSTIAVALGPDRTAKELFQALEQYCFPVEVQAAKSPEAYSNTDALAAKEEVLAAIAEQLGPEFVEYSGGSEATAKYMLPLLEKLAMVEETVIRQSAVSTLNKVILKLKVDDVRQHALPILNALVEADWFTSRCSASNLTPALFQVLNSEEDRRTILASHKRLCQDDMPMVKNDAYKNLVPLIDEMRSVPLIISFAKPLLEQLQNELMETMRQSMADIIKKISEKTEEEKSQDIVTQFVKAGVEDDSWRVRKHTAEQLPDICSHMMKQRVTEEISPLYVRLLADTEPQVRKATIGVLEKMIPTADSMGFASQIVNGPLQTLVSDSVAEVREALAEQVACLGEFLGKEGAKEKLLPVLKKLASDDSPHARLNLCSRLSSVSKILGIELFESEILPVLKEVTIDQRWRVRNSIVTNIAQIGIQMGQDKFAKSRLKEILIQSLKDPASTVRDTASAQVDDLFQNFGFDWTSKHLFAPMKAIYKESGNYLHRMVPLKTVKLMAARLTASQVRTEFEELLTSALSDPICNVRFTACRVLTAVLPIMDSVTARGFKSRLEKLAKEDTDDDVKYFAQEALDVC